MANRNSKNSINTLKELKSKEVEEFIRKKVIEVMREIVSDPDYGLELKPEFMKRLKKSLRSKRERQIVSFNKLLKKYK